MQSTGAGRIAVNPRQQPHKARGKACQNDKIVIGLKFGSANLVAGSMVSVVVCFFGSGWTLTPYDNPYFCKRR